MKLFNTFYYYLHYIFEYFTFRTKPISYIELQDLENNEEEVLVCSNE